MSHRKGADIINIGARVQWMKSSLLLRQRPHSSMAVALRVLVTACVVAGAIGASARPEMARTPPLGFNTWNKFSCGGISAQVLMDTADQFVKVIELSSLQACAWMGRHCVDVTVMRHCLLQ